MKKLKNITLLFNLNLNFLGMFVGISVFFILTFGDSFNWSKQFIVSNYIPKKRRFGLKNKVKFFNFFIPPFFAICSLILFSSSFIYFYSPFENIEKKELTNPE